MPNLRPLTIANPCGEPECPQDEFSNLADDVNDAVVENGGSLEWHIVVKTESGTTAPGGSVINDDFGFVENNDPAPGGVPSTPATTVVVLPYTHTWFVPRSQKKTLLPVAGDEFTADTDQVVDIPAAAIRAAGYDPSNMDINGSFFRFEDGTELRLETAMPTPKPNPLIVRVLGSNRKPERTRSV